jgi:hypothetical protein
VAAINTLSTTFAMLMASEYWPKASGEPSRRGKPTWTANAVTMKYSLAMVMNAIPLETPAFSDIRLVVSRGLEAVKKSARSARGTRAMPIESRAQRAVGRRAAPENPAGSRALRRRGHVGSVPGSRSGLGGRD